jgi:hypothetical protein
MAEGLMARMVDPLLQNDAAAQSGIAAERTA